MNEIQASASSDKLEEDPLKSLSDKESVHCSILPGEEMIDESYEHHSNQRQETDQK